MASSESRDEDPRREARRRYYWQHREKQREAARQWRQANRERSRELNRLSNRRQYARKKAVEAKRAAGRAWYAEHREQERERARTFRREHPEKVREYQRRFRERHPERAAQQNRRAAERWRDRNAPDVREKQRAAAAERRSSDPDTFRRWYQSNIEKERARGREASRLRSRLKKLGLPPRKIHRVYAEERRQNAAAGELFFTHRRSGADLRKLRMESFEATPGHRAALEARRRIMQPGAAVEVSPERLQAQLRAEKLRYRASELLPAVTERVESTRGARIRDEVRMDAVARELRGGPALDEESEVRRRIHDEAVARAAQRISESKRLGEPDAEKVARLLRATFPHPAGAPRPRHTSEPARRRKPAAQDRGNHRER